MAIFEFNIRNDIDVGEILQRLAAIETNQKSLQQLIGVRILNDLTVLKEKLDTSEAKSIELAAKVVEVNTTLGGLAQAVLDLKNATDQQAAIDALTTQAQGIVDNQQGMIDSLTAAEDAADDQLPGTPVPTP